MNGDKDGHVVDYSQEIPNRNNKVVDYDVDLNFDEYDEIERKEAHEAKSEEHHNLYIIIL
ncbi:hypothetical protein Glove_90g33 [Diversispora epigaea]|uniref:Uncharacterized protein n=1 Tax=Diversispora epigaea TaxID=1348612 RepID=A0A397J978_9GLOM|nr:hypothetical protein Glove_90g33 [Diversispora epigaea]